jgi:GR25 family glycosyltransferase involved in LPS biosynthesis
MTQLPVCSLNDVMAHLSEFCKILDKYKMLAQAFKPMEIINLLRIVDRLPWNMRLKTSSKIYDLVKLLRDQKYELNDWRYSYRLIHAMADWWTQGHPGDLYPLNQSIVEDLNAYFASAESRDKPVVITMTSCKRFDLLSRTLNSMLPNILDIKQHIREIVVFDDNSSEADRTLMTSMYPFIKFIMKTPEQKGHSKSMNMIRTYALENKYKYIFHVEDDWEFWFPDNYITKCLTVVEKDSSFGQALINFEYNEDEHTAINMWNRDMHYYKLPSQPTNYRYFVHEHFSGHRLQIEANNLKGTSSMYWPHFSFRVGITKTSVFETVGPFNEGMNNQTSFMFERDYADNYIKFGYVTAMLDCCYCTHIGKRTYERNDHTKKNAFELSTEQHSEGKQDPSAEVKPNPELMNAPPVTLPNVDNKHLANPVTTKTNVSINPDFMTNVRCFVLNLKRRPERLAKFIKNNNQECPPIEVFEGIDGMSLKPSLKIQKIFETGDYDFKRGIVGCAYSQFSIWSKFLKGTGDYCVVFEDDVKLCTNFKEKLCSLLAVNNFDVLFLHFNPYHHVAEAFKDWELDSMVATAEEWTVEQSMKQNMGSGAGYVLTRKAAKYLIDWVNKYGMPNAVDWVLMKQPELKIMYSKPKLVFANCWQQDQTIVSDIQTVHTKVKYDSADSLFKEELKYWLKILGSTGINQQTLKIDGFTSDCNSYMFADKVYPFNKGWKEIRHRVYVCPADAEVPAWLAVKWYNPVPGYKIIVPDLLISNKVYQDKVWGDNRVNMISV